MYNKNILSENFPDIEMIKALLPRLKKITLIKNV